MGRRLGLKGSVSQQFPHIFDASCIKQLGNSALLKHLHGHGTAGSAAAIEEARFWQLGDAFAVVQDFLVGNMDAAFDMVLLKFVGGANINQGKGSRAYGF